MNATTSNTTAAPACTLATLTARSGALAASIHLAADVVATLHDDPDAALQRLRDTVAEQSARLESIAAEAQQLLEAVAGAQQQAQHALDALTSDTNTALASSTPPENRTCPVSAASESAAPVASQQTQSAADEDMVVNLPADATPPAPALAIHTAANTPVAKETAEASPAAPMPTLTHQTTPDAISSDRQPERQPKPGARQRRARKPS